MFLALYGNAQVADAETQSDAPADILQVITVTASRREQTTEEIPFSLSVISAAQLTNENVTDIASLAMPVPGLSVYDFGSRFAGATSPIIRGLNATSEPGGFRTFEQDPVGTYGTRLTGSSTYPSTQPSGRPHEQLRH